MNPFDLPKPDVADKQSELNRSTRGQWHLYSTHRQELERLIVPSAPGGRICILGAGNCNDLDLHWLTQVYGEVHLVDIDPTALARAVKFQKVEGNKRLHLRGNFDLTGLADRLSGWHKHPPNEEQINACLADSRKSTAASAQQLGGPFDVVLSPCVLSQLLTPLRDTIGEGHPSFEPLLSAMRLRHIRFLLDLLGPGGRGVLACDLFSSMALADLARVPREQAGNVMSRMLATNRHFSGLDPDTLTTILKRDPAIAPRVADLRFIPPWIWHMSLSKSYLVYAIMWKAAAS
jgi:hypothetical protein